MGLTPPPHTHTTITIEILGLISALTPTAVMEDQVVNGGPRHGGQAGQQEAGDQSQRAGLHDGEAAVFTELLD